MTLFVNYCSLLLFLIACEVSAATNGYLWNSLLTCGDIDLTNWNTDLEPNAGIETCFDTTFYGPIWGNHFIFRPFSSVPPHAQVRINFTLFVIDAWQDQYLALSFGGTTIFNQKFNYQTFSGSDSVNNCGDPTVPDLKTTQSILITHSATTPQQLQIKGYLTQTEEVASWGICGITIELFCPTNYFYYNNNCIQTCPPGTYRDDSTGCSPCNGNCKTCNGPDSNHCTGCSDGHVLLVNGSSQACEDSCPATTWLRNSDSTCQNCSSPCKSCTGGLNNQCLDCIDDTYFLDGTVCKHTCSAGGWPNSANHKCDPCTSPCKSCSDSSTTSCLSCIDNHYLMDGSCLEGCQAGYWANKDTQQCELCFYSCATCSGKRICETCKPNYYKYLNDCVTECPENTKKDLETRTCSIIVKKNKSLRNLIILVLAVVLGSLALLVTAYLLVRKCHNRKCKTEEINHFKRALFPTTVEENFKLPSSDLQQLRTSGTINFSSKAQSLTSIQDLNRGVSLRERLKKIDTLRQQQSLRERKDISAQPNSKRRSDLLVSSTNSLDTLIWKFPSQDSQTPEGISVVNIPSFSSITTSLVLDDGTPKSTTSDQRFFPQAQVNYPPRSSSVPKARSPINGTKLRVNKVITADNVIEEVPESPTLVLSLKASLKKQRQNSAQKQLERESGKNDSAKKDSAKKSTSPERSTSPRKSVNEPQPTSLDYIPTINLIPFVVDLEEPTQHKRTKVRTIAESTTSLTATEKISAEDRCNSINNMRGLPNQARENGVKRMVAHSLVDLSENVTFQRTKRRRPTEKVPSRIFDF